jgi:hypothetical protein
MYKEHGLFMGPVHCSRCSRDCPELGPFVMQTHGKKTHFLLFRANFITMFLFMLQIYIDYVKQEAEEKVQFLMAVCKRIFLEAHL